VKPICGRMNNCLNGRRRYRENIIQRCGMTATADEVVIFFRSLFFCRHQRDWHTRARHYAERDDNKGGGGNKEKTVVRWRGNVRARQPIVLVGCGNE